MYNNPINCLDINGKEAIDASLWYRGRIKITSTPITTHPFLRTRKDTPAYLDFGEKILYREADDPLIKMTYFEVKFRNTNENALSEGYVYRGAIDTYYDNRVLNEIFQRYHVPGMHIDPSSGQSPVKILQRLLNMYITDSGADLKLLCVDGYYGEKTQAVVELFRGATPQVDYGDEKYVGFKTFQSLSIYNYDANIGE